MRSVKSTCILRQERMRRIEKVLNKKAQLRAADAINKKGRIDSFLRPQQAKQMSEEEKAKADQDLAALLGEADAADAADKTDVNGRKKLKSKSAYDIAMETRSSAADDVCSVRMLQRIASYRT